MTCFEYPSDLNWRHTSVCEKYAGGGSTAEAIRAWAMFIAEMKSGFMTWPDVPSRWFRTQYSRSSAVSSKPRHVGVMPLHPRKPNTCQQRGKKEIEDIEAEDSPAAASTVNFRGFEALSAHATGIGSK